MMNKNLINIPLLASLLLLLISSCNAQRPVLSNNVEGINQYDIEIKKLNSSSINIGDPGATLINLFGSPNSSVNYVFEMKETTGKLHKYSSNEFYIMYDKLYAFELVTNMFQVGVSGNYVKVGDDISKVSVMYDKANNFKKSTRFRIQLTLGDKVNEGSFLIIEFNPSTNLITKIWTYES